MATTQSNTAFTWATGGPTASGTTNPIGTAGSYAATVDLALVQTGTATGAATVQVQESPDGGTTWYSPPTKVFTAGLAAGTYYAQIPIDPTTTKVQLVYAAQSGGTSSSLTGQIAQITGV